MAAEDTAKKARDNLLDDLDKALDDFYAKEKRRIAAEEDIIKRLLKAQSSASSLAKANVTASKILLISNIETFLTG